MNLIFTVNFIDCLFLSFYLFIVCAYVCGEGAYARCSMFVEVRGQLLRVTSWDLGSNLSYQIGEQQDNQWESQWGPNIDRAAETRGLKQTRDALQWTLVNKEKWIKAFTAGLSVSQYSFQGENDAFLLLFCP